MLKHRKTISLLMDKIYLIRKEINFKLKLFCSLLCEQTLIVADKTYDQFRRNDQFLSQ